MVCVSGGRWATGFLVMAHSIRTCGLCAQLTDGAIKLTVALRAFLSAFVDVNDEDLPSKVCSECYSGVVDSKKFKDRCFRSLMKLRNSGQSDNERPSFADDVILLDDEPLSRAMVQLKRDWRVTSNVRVSIAHSEWAAAERALENNGELWADKAFGKRLHNTSKVEAFELASLPQPSTPRTAKSKAAKTASGSRPTANGRPAPAGPARARKRTWSAALDQDPLVTDNVGMTKDASTPNCSVSSFGRVRKIKKGYVFPEEGDDFGIDDFPLTDAAFEPHDIKQVDDDDFSYGERKRKTKSKVKKEPAAVKHEKVAKKKRARASLDDDDEGEEMFPSTGPYQCEICQEVTDTKVQFVGHIKAFHMDALDEEVLRNLEADLRKQKKKEQSKPLQHKATIKSEDVSLLTCSRCHKIVSTAQELERHKKVCGLQPNQLNQPAAPRPTAADARLASARPVKPKASLAQTPAAASVTSLLVEAPPQREGVTCQYCSKTLSSHKDLSNHYMTKACQAKRYENERQRGGNSLVETSAFVTADRASEATGPALGPYSAAALSAPAANCVVEPADGAIIDPLVLHDPGFTPVAHHSAFQGQGYAQFQHSHFMMSDLMHHPHGQFYGN